LAADSCPCEVAAANRVTSNCWYQRRCGAVGVHYPPKTHAGLQWAEGGLVGVRVGDDLTRRVRAAARRDPTNRERTGSPTSADTSRATLATALLAPLPRCEERRQPKTYCRWRHPPHRSLATEFIATPSSPPLSQPPSPPLPSPPWVHHAPHSRRGLARTPHGGRDEQAQHRLARRRCERGATARVLEQLVQHAQHRHADVRIPAPPRSPRSRALTRGSVG
jgi:hypothetical protein